MRDLLTPTLEAYLLTIFKLEKQHRVVRAKDIKSSLSVAKSTVTAALQSLADKKFIRYSPYEAVVLTEEGYKIAEELHLRNHILRDFLQKILAFDEEQAATVARSMEHTLDRFVLERFVCFMAFHQANRVDSDLWLNDFREFISSKDQNEGENNDEHEKGHEGKRGKFCKKCIDKYLAALSDKVL
jgi:DtxR family Mn-dependent transcriptional regulator